MKNLGADLSSLDRLAEVIIESLGDGVLIVDKNGLVHRHNQRFCEMWGIDPLPNGVQDSLDLALLVKKQMRNPEAFLESIHSFSQRKGNKEHVDHLEFLDGRIFERRQRSLCDQGLDLGRLLVFRDVTNQIQAEKASRALALQVQATQRLESLGVLAGGLAHEFNNILMVIMGNADLLASEFGTSPSAQTHLSEIGTASRRAADLCDQMHVYAGKGNSRREELDLARVVREMRPILDIALGKKVDLGCEFQTDLPKVMADVTRFRQVVLNLVSNAADACLEEGMGRVDLRLLVRNCDQSFLRGCLSGGKVEPGQYVCLEVVDTGCGMDPAQQARVFDPFYTTKFAGRGLGLSAVLGIVRRCKGAVKVQSQMKEGSNFSIFLPVVNE